MWKKKIFVICIVVLTVLNISVVYGNSNLIHKSIDAVYRGIAMWNNGVLIQTEHEPFIVGDTTYVPIRDVAEAFGKTVTWNEATSTINFNGQGTDDYYQRQIQSLEQQLNEKTALITDLQDQLLNQVTYGDEDLLELEEDLEDKYDDYRDVEFTFDLSGDEDDLTIEVEYDDSQDGDEWDDFSSSNKRSLVKAICKDIWDEDEYEDADIEGEIIEHDSGDTVVEFTADSGKTPDVDFNTDGDDEDLGDIEEDLEDEYDDYDNVEFTFNLRGDEDDLTVKIEYDDSQDGDEWDDFSSSDKRRLVGEICDDIWDYNEYEDADIEGEIIEHDSGDTVVEFTADSGRTPDVDFSPDGDEEDLGDIEEDLEDAYDDYDNVEFTFDLRGDEDDLTVKIEYDDSQDGDEWDDFSSSDKRRLVEEICDDIWDYREYEDADIEGEIIEHDSGDRVAEFTADSGKTPDVDLYSSFEELEDELEDKYDTKLEDIVISNLQLEKDDDDINFTVEIDLDDYDDEWDHLSDSKIKNYLLDITSDIDNEDHDYNKIYGEIIDDDGDTIARLEYRNSGSFTFHRE